MKINTDRRIQSLDIKVAERATGLLAKKALFEFSYHSDAINPVSITMPINDRYYQHGVLLPIFEMNLPEGFIRYRITEQLRKHIPVDDMLFLALQGSSGIGRISYHTPEIELDYSPGENLAEILGWQGRQDLFNELLEKYLLSTSISGVQPKVVVPETLPDYGKGTLLLPSLIIKAWDDEFPDLAANEYICMRLAKANQIDTPDFWLSDNHRLFVMRRFDLTAKGSFLGMEDMAVLQGKSTDKKYASSYESIAKAINLFSSEPAKDMDIFYKVLVHSCMVGNGDAHLKNFAILYEHPDHVHLSPAYDIVNTQLYRPDDSLALRMDKSKDFPDRRRIENFGKAIGIKHVAKLIGQMADQIRDELENLTPYFERMSMDMKSSLLHSIHRTTSRQPLKSHPKRRYSKTQ